MVQPVLQIHRNPPEYVMAVGQIACPSRLVVKTCTTVPVAVEISDTELLS
jgi:hypothetical protein